MSDLPLYRGQGNEQYRTSRPLTGARRGQRVPYDVNGKSSVSTTADTLTTPRTISATGDATWGVTFNGGSNVSAALTLATVNANTGMWGSATQAPQITLDAKGRAIAAANVTITPAFSSITSTPTTLGGYGITDAQALNANLTAISGLTTAADKMIYWTGAGTAALLTVTAANRTGLSNLSGTNSGDQTITLTGDATGSGTGSFAVTIPAGTITLAKMANVATGTVFYRKTAATGVPEVQALATLKTDLGLTGTNSGDQTITLTGDATGSGTGSFAVTVGKINGVSLAGLATGILKNTTTTGVPSIAVAADFPILNQNTTGSAATLTTPRSIDGQAFNGSADITVIAPGTHAATSKATPVDADELPLVDSAASNVLKRLTWANLKATLKAYFDTLYVPTPTAWTATGALTVAPGSGAFTTVSASGRYKIVGKIIHLSVNVNITTNGTAASWIDVTLPSAITALAGNFHILAAREVNAVGFMTCAGLFNGTTLRLQKYDATYPGGSGYILQVTGSYEAA